MSKACMNVSDLAGTIYDGCRITKGKGVLFFGNLNALRDILEYHFGITDFNKQSIDEKYYESLLPKLFKEFALKHKELKGNDND